MLFLICLSISILQQAQAFSNSITGINGSSIKHVSLQLHNNKTLNITQVGSYTLHSNIECVKKCFDFEICKSMNYFPFSTATNCVLLSGNMYMDRSKFIDFPNGVHISIKNTGCDSGVCLNNGLCIPNYDNDTSTCVCSSEYTGRYCEQKVMTEATAPAWYFPFNGSTTNYGQYPAGCQITLNKNDGKLVYVPDRVGRVLYCYDGVCTTSIINLDVWFDPVEFINGVTISIWVKIRPGVGSVHYFSKEGRGFVMRYNSDHTRWEFYVYYGSGRFLSLVESPVKETLRWHHLVLTYWHKYSMFHCYVDGKQYTGTDESRAEKEAQQSQLFKYPGSSYMDDFKVWFRHLSEEDVIKEYQSSKNRI